MIGITGSSGFIGSYITEHLSFPKKVLLRIPDRVTFSNTEVFQGDLANIKDVHPFLQDCPFLIHLACNSNPRFSQGRFLEDLECNLLPCINLFESYARLNPKGHIIFASTGGNMYQDSPNTPAKTEEDVPYPRSGYGVHKLAAEHYLRLIAESYGISATVLRISNPYGANVDLKRTQGLIGVAFAKLRTGQVLQIYDSKDTLRDYIHLDDVLNVLEIILNKECQGFATYNISSGVGVSIEEVIHEIEIACGEKLNVEYTLESLKKKASWSILSFEKARKELGWHPKVSLRDGLKKMHLQSSIFV